MKVYCINFQEVVEGRRTNAMTQELFNIFNKKNSEQFIFLTSYVKGDFSPYVRGMNKWHLLFFKLLDRVSTGLKIPYYLKRTWLEQIVDYSLYRQLKKEKEPFLLVSTMYAVRCTRYAKKRNNKVLFWAGNLNDELYYSAVKGEQKRLGLDYTDVFCSKYRLDIYKRMFQYIDYVRCPNSLAMWSFREINVIRDPREIKNYPIIYPKKYASEVPDIIKIGYFGHTTLLKGVHLLPEALSLCKHKQHIEIVIAGNVDIYVKEIIDKYDVKVTYLGFVDEANKNKVIQSFDYMAIPSLYDAGPMTIPEAIKCDVPIIVSDGCGGVERVSENEKCIVFKTMNIEDLANKLDYAYEHRTEYLQPTEIDTCSGMDTSHADDFFDIVINKIVHI